jgi:predicted metalloprotease
VQKRNLETSRPPPEGATWTSRWTERHEFGHIMQYTSGMHAWIRGGQPTSKRTELHADFMSGYYIGRLKKDNPTASFWKAGDKFRQIGSYDHKDPQFHGTPQERVNASQEGFKIGFGFGAARDAKSAFQVGMDYVSGL